MAARLKEIRETLFGPRGGTKMAALLGVTQPTYHAYENAQIRLPYRVINTLAIKKNIDPFWLLAGRGSKWLRAKQTIASVGKAEEIYGGQAVSAPILESVGARDPQNINELKPVDQVIVDNHFTTPGMVCLRVRGNSMETEIPDGSIVGVDVRKRQFKDLQTRKAYVIWVRQGGIVIRRLYKEGKNLSFIPDNLTLENRPYTYKYLKKERRYDEEPVINGRVEWVLNQLIRD